MTEVTEEIQALYLKGLKLFGEQKHEEAIAAYEEALAWVSQDPMIQAGLVDWTLQEWIPVSGDGWP